MSEGVKRKLEEKDVEKTPPPTKVIFSFDIEARGDDLLKHGMLAIGWCVGAIDEDRVLEKGRLCLKPLLYMDPEDILMISMYGVDGLRGLPGGETDAAIAERRALVKTQCMDPKCLEEFWYNEEKCPGGRAKLAELQSQAIDAGDAMRQLRATLDKWDDGKEYKAVIVSDNILFDGGWVDYYLSRFGLRRLHLTPQGKYRRVYDTVDYRRGLVKMDYGERWLDERGIIEKFGLTVDPASHTHMPEEDAEYIYRFHQQLVAKAAVAYDDDQLTAPGPYLKDHPVVAAIRKTLDGHSEIENDCMGFTYEDDDHYTIMWFKTLRTASAARQLINERFGRDIATEPGLISASDILNPFVLDAAAFNLMPYRT